MPSLIRLLIVSFIAGSSFIAQADGTKGDTTITSSSVSITPDAAAPAIEPEPAPAPEEKSDFPKSSNSTIPSFNSTIPSSNSTIPSSNSTIPSSNSTIPSSNSKLPESNSQELEPKPESKSTEPETELESKPESNPQISSTHSKIPESPQETDNKPKAQEPAPQISSDNSKVPESPEPESKSKSQEPEPETNPKTLIPSDNSKIPESPEPESKIQEPETKPEPQIPSDNSKVPESPEEPETKIPSDSSKVPESPEPEPKYKSQEPEPESKTEEPESKTPISSKTSRVPEPDSKEDKPDTSDDVPNPESEIKDNTKPQEPTNSNIKKPEELPNKEAEIPKEEDTPKDIPVIEKPVETKTVDIPQNQTPLITPEITKSEPNCDVCAIPEPTVILPCVECISTCTECTPVPPPCFKCHEFVPCLSCIIPKPVINTYGLDCYRPIPTIEPIISVFSDLLDVQVVEKQTNFDNQLRSALELILKQSEQPKLVVEKVDTSFANLIKQFELNLSLIQELKLKAQESENIKSLLLDSKYQSICLTLGYTSSSIGSLSTDSIFNSLGKLQLQFGSSAELAFNEYKAACTTGGFSLNSINAQYNGFTNFYKTYFSSSSSFF